MKNIPLKSLPGLEAFNSFLTEKNYPNIKNSHSMPPESELEGLLLMNQAKGWSSPLWGSFRMPW